MILALIALKVFHRPTQLVQATPRLWLLGGEVSMRYGEMGVTGGGHNAGEHGMPNMGLFLQLLFLGNTVLLEE